jgi:hypothetical protein
MSKIQNFRNYVHENYRVYGHQEISGLHKNLKPDEYVEGMLTDAMQTKNWAKVQEAITFIQTMMQVSESESEPLSDDDLKPMRDLGLAQEEDFDTRWQRFEEEWGEDSEISRAITVVTNRTIALRDKLINLADDEDSEEYESKMYDLGEQGIDSLGWLEYTLINEGGY